MALTITKKNEMDFMGKKICKQCRTSALDLSFYFSFFYYVEFFMVTLARTLLF